MFFRFNFLLLSSIITANSTPTDIFEEKFLQEGYDFALKTYYVRTGEGLKSSDIRNFVDYKNYPIVQNYLQTARVTTKHQEDINFQLFKDIIGAICVARNINVIDFVGERSRVIKLENKEFDEAYQAAKKYYHVPQKRGLTASDMVDFLGTNNVPSIEKYWTDNNISSRVQGNIRLKLFKNVVRAVCETYEFNERDFISSRKEVAKNAAEEGRTRISV